MPTLQESIHARHVQERAHILDAFEQSPELQKRSARFDDCSFHGRLYLEGDPPEVRLWIHRCGDRLCPLCAGYRSRRVAEQLRKLMYKCSNVRHVTLTIKNLPAGELQEGLNHLRSSFTKLRRTPEWKSKVHGGAYVLEITRNKTTNEWHPHLHILANGIYFPHRLLKALWADASDGSEICWVSVARGKTANYLAKYCAKPPHLEAWPGEAIAEYAIATHGQRMLQTFGDLHAVQLEDADPRPEPSATRSYIGLSELRNQAAAGHPAAVAVLRAAAIRWPSLWQFLRTATDLDPPAKWDALEITRERAQEMVNHSAKYILSLTSPISETQFSR